MKSCCRNLPLKMLNRRNFLLSTAAGITALALPPGVAMAQGAGLDQALTVDRWASLRGLIGDGLIRAGEAGFDNAALPNNLRFSHVRPEGIAYCSTPQMVAEVINWCRHHDMPFAIRGGGHSYAGYSTSHGLVIDMALMNEIALAPETGIATIGAGAINASVYAALDEAGRTITHGRCPTVGIAGYLLGGGIGFNMRRYGMACDALISAEMVTADGRILTLSAEENPDLFWAIRGGAGGNFGVMTAFTLETQPADAAMTVVRMVWRSNVLDVATALFATLDAAPDALGTRISFGGLNAAMLERGRQVPLTLLGQFAGTRADFEALMAPVLALGAPEFSEIMELGYWDAQTFLSDAGDPEHYRERSSFHDAAPSREFLETAIAEMARWPGTGSSANLVFFQTGGRINETAADATAFVHRQSRWLSTANLSWAEDDVAREAVVRANTDWQDRLYGHVTAADTRGAFQNFPDPSLVDWRERYYGENLPRLSAIKGAIDPTNVFRFGQSI
jgi:hypothetical protein